MNLPLPLHILIHIALALLAGFIVYKLYKKPFLSFVCVIISGVFVDFDHFIDYFLAFGWNFRLNYFIAGYQFLKSDKIYIFWHGWEYVIILTTLALIAKKKTFKTVFLGLALGLFFHLSADVIIDRVPIKTYSIIYRAKSNFDSEKLVYPEHWEKHLLKKEKINFE